MTYNTVLSTVLFFASEYGLDIINGLQGIMTDS